ncbi:MAG: hypothetical protein A2583_10600 [Bdellovibrionales bacterium RIFOXYD1_FULL_53_11]|nr:MAG: hypothetical protein A2583_10600 [Bdellovibrionales bacterium RIFOXYD1_FULL_53_11]
MSVKTVFQTISGERAQREYEELLGSAFGVPQGTSFFDDFPVWDERHGADIYRAGAYDGGRLVAAASCRIARLAVAKGSVSVAVIGGVVTHASHRGRGLASEAVNIAIEHAASQGAVLALLWGSEHSMYRKLGFELCGVQSRVPIKQIKDRLVSHAFSGMKTGTGWQDAVFKCMRGREGGFIIENKDKKWLSAHKNVHWWWIGDNLEVRAYAAVGRGIDLGGMIHEWGGDKEALMLLLARLQETGPMLEILGSPALFEKYGFNPAGSVREHLCMARVVDAGALARAGGVDPAGAAPDARWFFGAPDARAARMPLWVWGLDAA